MAVTVNDLDENDPHDLMRFVSAQADCFDTALGEISAGQKRTHWMWFVFPQLDGLGFSAMARRYAIRSAGEARAYLAHPVLGPRLMRCCTATLGHPGKSATAIFGSPDDVKLWSSMTLFAKVSPNSNSEFRQVLDRFFEGRPDQKTLSLLAASDK